CERRFGGGRASWRALPEGSRELRERNMPDARFRGVAPSAAPASPPAPRRVRALGRALLRHGRQGGACSLASLFLRFPQAGLLVRRPRFLWAYPVRGCWCPQSCPCRRTPSRRRLVITRYAHFAPHAKPITPPMAARGGLAPRTDIREG